MEIHDADALVLIGVSTYIVSTARDSCGRSPK
jgi:hypothetical protein